MIAVYLLVNLLASVYQIKVLADFNEDSFKYIKFIPKVSFLSK